MARVFQTGRSDTLNTAVETALAKEVQRGKVEHILGRDIGASHAKTSRWGTVFSP